MSDVSTEIVDKSLIVLVDKPEVFTFGSGENLPPGTSIEVLLAKGEKVKLAFPDTISFDYIPTNSLMVRHKEIIDNLIPKDGTTTLYKILNSDWIKELSDVGLLKDKIYNHYVLILPEFLYQIVSSDSIVVQKINTHFRDL